MTIACVEGSRYFDLDAVRTPASPGKRTEWTYRDGDDDAASQPGNSPRKRGGTLSDNPAGAPPLDYWEIPPQPYSGSHYAVYPPALLERPLKSMVPHKVCRVCGEPSRRIVGEPTYERTDSTRVPPRLAKSDGFRLAEGVNQHRNADGANTSVFRVAETLGWTDCGHDDWRPGIVLDPFAGSGTTLMVASGLGRAAIGFDLDERNVELARDRVGPMLLDDIRLDDTSAVVA